MLAPQIINDLAHRLEHAENNQVVCRPFSSEFSDITIEDAYAIQRAWLDIKTSAGRKCIGHKIGLTSRAMQHAAGFTDLCHGFLLDTMLFHDGATFTAERFMAPRIEVELAFILGKALSGPDCSVFDVLNATGYICPALELLDNRLHKTDPVTEQGRTIHDTIADNVSTAGIVLGGRPFRPSDPVDLRWVSALCYRNASLEESGVAAVVYNNPASSVAWLANTLAVSGEALRPGDIILSGSFIRPVEAPHGSTIFADYGPLGTITCHFA